MISFSREDAKTYNLQPWTVIDHRNEAIDLLWATDSEDVYDYVEAHYPDCKVKCGSPRE
jgi:hypothetical protein